MALDNLLYFLIAVGISIMITAAFRRLRERQDSEGVSEEEDAAFERRIDAIERQYGEKDGNRDRAEDDGVRVE